MNCLLQNKLHEEPAGHTDAAVIGVTVKGDSTVQEPATNSELTCLDITKNLVLVGILKYRFQNV